MDPSRRKLAPPKRKARDETFDFLRSSKPKGPVRPPRPPPPPPPPRPKPVAPPPQAPAKPPKAAVSSPAQAPANNNILLAGYMAYEYLNKGTLFGQRYIPATPPAPPAASSAGSKTMRQPSSGPFSRDKGKAVELKPKPKPSEMKRIDEPQLVKNQRYADVSQLLKDGVHIPGIVNPSQLARFLNI